VRERGEDLEARATLVGLWAQGHRAFSAHDAADLVGTRTDAIERLVRRVPGLEARVPDESAVGLAATLDVQVYMACQLLRDSDATSMSQSLELRVPFVDTHVAAFARTCRDGYKIGPHGVGKRVLARAFQDDIPPGVMARKKRGFTLPLTSWMQAELSERVEQTCDVASVRKRGLVDAEAWARTWNHGLRSRSEFWWPRAWSLLVLETWCREVLDAPVPRPA
jgi:asparagine synthase (glutamine-hydrolysing)